MVRTWSARPLDAGNSDVVFHYDTGVSAPVFSPGPVVFEELGTGGDTRPMTASAGAE